MFKVLDKVRKHKHFKTKKFRNNFETQRNF